MSARAVSGALRHTEGDGSSGENNDDDEEG